MTTQAYSLNYYSKNSLAREKKNIESLYTLIRNDNRVNPAHPLELTFKLGISRQDLLRRNESLRELIARQKPQQHQQIQAMHEQQQLQISRKQNLPEECLSLASSLSRASLISFFKEKKMQIYRTHSGDHLDNPKQSLWGLQQNCSEVKSIFADENGLESLPPDHFQPNQNSLAKSVTPEHHCLRQGDLKQRQVPQPLQPEIQASNISTIPVPLLASYEKQVPDKIQTEDREYDQRDFFDGATSPIKLIKQNSQKSLKSRVSESRLKHLKSILMDMEAPVDPSEGSGGRVSVVKGRVEGDKKKQSFKAMMKKHKDEVQQQRERKNKKLLFNFFDQN